MKLTIVGGLIACLFSLNALGANDSLDKWSTAPLKDTIYSAEEVATDSETLLAWLATNYASLTDKEKAEPRSKLYNLIDAHIKQLHLTSGAFTFAKADPLLEKLFFWAEKLGAYGGSLVYNAIKSSAAPALDQSLMPPEGFSLTFNEGLYHVKSTTEGWGLHLPYNFILSTITRFKAGNGLPTEILVFTFGTAATDNKGLSDKSSIMLIRSPGARKRKFSTYWKEQFGITRSAERVELGVKDITSQTEYDDQSGLQVEIALWSDADGQFAISYTGSKQAHAKNRPHFINVLQALEM